MAQEVVVDTSAVLAVVLSEPARQRLIALTRGLQLRAADSLQWEIGNALVAACRRGRLDGPTADTAWRNFALIQYRTVELDISSAIALAIGHGIYAYDAYVIHAARSIGAPLLTLDRRQAAVATANMLEVIEV